MGPARPPCAREAVVVAALHVAPARRAPMEQVDEIEVQAGAGVVGDRYHGTRHRHVSVQSLADLADVAAELGRPVSPADTRRTITLGDGHVPSEPGARVRIGDVVLEVVRLAAPCRVMEDNLGPGGRRALRRRGGSVFRALTGGVVRLGDPVDLDPAQGAPPG